MNIKNKFDLLEKVYIWDQTWIVYKIWIDSNKVISYLIWVNFETYVWLEEFQITKVSDYTKIWFDTKEKKKKSKI